MRTRALKQHCTQTHWRCASRGGTHLTSMQERGLKNRIFFFIFCNEIELMLQLFFCCVCHLKVNERAAPRRATREWVTVNKNYKWVLQKFLCCKSFAGVYIVKVIVVARRARIWYYIKQKILSRQFCIYDVKNLTKGGGGYKFLQNKQFGSTNGPWFVYNNNVCSEIVIISAFARGILYSCGGGSLTRCERREAFCEFHEAARYETYEYTISSEELRMKPLHTHALTCHFKFTTTRDVCAILYRIMLVKGKTFSPAFV